MRYQVNTVWASEVVIEQAKRHLGPQGAGLQVISENVFGITFQSGGYVALTVRAESKQAMVELEAREWDFLVQHVGRARQASRMVLQTLREFDRCYAKARYTIVETHFFISRRR